MAEFWELMTQDARIDPPGRQAVAEQVATALSTGWTPQSLAAWADKQLRSARRRGAVGNPGGFLVAQLKLIPPAEQQKPARGSAAPDARIAAMLAQGEAGARLADQMLGTREWVEPQRGEHSAREYMLEVVPAAARAFIEARREALTSVMTTNPMWRVA